MNPPPVKRDRYHVFAPGHMVSCVICRRLSAGRESPRDARPFVGARSGGLAWQRWCRGWVRALFQCVLNDTVQVCYRFRLTEKKLSLTSKLGGAISLLKTIRLPPPPPPLGSLSPPELLLIFLTLARSPHAVSPAKNNRSIAPTPARPPGLQHEPPHPGEARALGRASAPCAAGPCDSLCR